MLFGARQQPPGGAGRGSLLPPSPQVRCLRFPAAPAPQLALPAQLPGLRMTWVIHRGAENDLGHPSALAGTVLPTSESPASLRVFVSESSERFSSA